MPLIVGLATFLLGALGLSVVMAVTTSKPWHDRHHTNRSELMCDHCRERRRISPGTAPRLRVLGEPRR
jgi:hypothetical protein